MLKFGNILVTVVIAGAGVASIGAKADDEPSTIRATDAGKPAIQLIRKKIRIVTLPDQAAVLVVLNAGSVDKVERLPGIDPDLAYEIIRQRPFASLTALADKHVMSSSALQKFVNQFPAAR